MTSPLHGGENTTREYDLGITEDFNLLILSTNAAGDDYRIVSMELDIATITDDVDLQFDVTGTDGDGDQASGTLDITVAGGNGGDGNLVGDAGDEVLQGGTGDDMINGKGGDDIMSGDGGADTFVFDGDAVGTMPDPFDDLILDFIDNVDSINLDALFDSFAVATADRGVSLTEGDFDGDGDVVDTMVTLTDGGTPIDYFSVTVFDITMANLANDIDVGDDT